MTRKTFIRNRCAPSVATTRALDQVHNTEEQTHLWRTDGFIHLPETQRPENDRDGRRALQTSGRHAGWQGSSVIVDPTLGGDKPTISLNQKPTGCGHRKLSSTERALSCGHCLGDTSLDPRQVQLPSISLTKSILTTAVPCVP